MKKVLTYFTLLCCFITLTIGCGSIGRISKSGDPELMYKTAMKLYKAQKWHRASSLFDACAGYYVGSEREDSILFFSARSKFKRRDYAEAETAFDEFRRKFGRSVFIEDAEGMYAMSQYYLSPDRTRDQTLTAQAIVSLTTFNERYPDSPKVGPFKELVEELTQRLHDKNFYNAYTYYKIRKFKSAVVAFRNALKEYGNSTHREEIMYYLVASKYHLAHSSIPSKQSERYLSLLDSYYTFLEEYPQSKYCKELKHFAEEAKDHIDKSNIKNKE